MVYKIDKAAYLAHYGILRRSGRFPWGSGEDEATRSKTFIGMVTDLKKQGLSEVEIAEGFGMTTSELRDTKTIARAEFKASQISWAQRLKNKGMSNVAIGETMNLNESSVRALLAPGEKEKAENLASITNMLRDQIDQKGVVDVGVGVERHLGISQEKLGTALSILKDEGYFVDKVQTPQVQNNNKTIVRVAAKPGTTYRDIVSDMERVQNLDQVSSDGGREWSSIQPPLSIKSSRVGVRYAEDGGKEADGVIYVRPGVKDVDLGGSRYAQVRIAVDGSHYLKGMAIYKDDLPDGVDLVFNTNKSNTGNKLDAMKPLKTDKDGNVDPKDPFGSSISRQILSKDSNGKDRVDSVMNLVNEEGKWDDWSKNLASQFLSKQKPALAKEQLGTTFKKKQDELDEILSLTNPAVRKKLLESYADDVDSSSVHLKAAQMPRQATQVLIPVNAMKDTEIYAPNFHNGERVVLVRYPHGGTFEIPELVVNNNRPEAKRLLGDAKDAVGINHKVAERLSGADFDGDTVLVIPNDKNKIKSTPALEGLKNFDAKAEYPAYEGMPRMTTKQKATEMGKVSNLITDMTIKGANNQEIARAVRHSMVVIDAEKHNLNYKLSAVNNGISQLKKKYQGSASAGASTLISRTTSEQRVNKRKPQYRIDPLTGEKIWIETGETFTTRKVSKRTGEVTETVKLKTSKSTKGAEARDAHELSSGTAIEKIYADHANRLKSLANEARRVSVNTKTIPYSSSAAKVYSAEVKRLDAALNVALKNAPLERQAQILANAQVKAKQQSNPDMDADDLKKVKTRALIEARARVGADRNQIQFEGREWEAVQAGAISNSKLLKILNNADIDQVKSLATPRANSVMSSSKLRRAESLRASGATWAEIASTLGVPISTVKSHFS